MSIADSAMYPKALLRNADTGNGDGMLLLTLTMDLGLAILACAMPLDINLNILQRRYAAISDAIRYEGGANDYFVACMLCCMLPLPGAATDVEANAQAIARKYKDLLAALPADLANREVAAAILALEIDSSSIQHLAQVVGELRTALVGIAGDVDIAAVIMPAFGFGKFSAAELAERFRKSRRAIPASNNDFVPALLSHSPNKIDADRQAVAFAAVHDTLPSYLLNRDIISALLVASGMDARYFVEARQALNPAKRDLDLPAAVLATARLSNNRRICHFRDLGEAIAPSLSPRVVSGVCPPSTRPGGL